LECCQVWSFSQPAASFAGRSEAQCSSDPWSARWEAGELVDLQAQSSTLALCSQGVIATAGHEVPLSVALDRTTPVLPVEILGNQTRHHSGGNLLILIAVTSTCCTMQVCWQYQYAVGVLLHKGVPHLHWRPCRQPCPFMQAQHRRNAIRQSWALTMAKSPSPVDLKFVLAQPNDSKIADAHSLLQVQSITYVASFCCFG